MGIFDKLNPMRYINSAKQGNVNTPQQSVKVVNMGNNLSGVNVDEDNILTIPAIYDGIRAIGQGLGSLSLVTYMDTDTGRTKARDHRLYHMLAKRPNRYMSRIEFIERMVSDAIIWGKGYAYYNRETRELVPLDARCTADGIYDNEHYIVSKVNGEWIKFYGYEVIVLTNYLGLSIVDLFSQTLGVNIAQERYVAKFFDNGGRVGGKLMYKGELDEEDIADIAQSWDAMYSGAKNSHKDMILSSDWDYVKDAFSPEQAQLIATRQYSIVEIARVLGIPPSKIKDLAKANYNSLELQAQDFFDNCLRHWAIRLESELNSKLFAFDEDYYVEFLFESLLRADSKTKADVYSRYLSNGVMTLNEVRAAQNLPRVEGGDLNLIQLNMTSHQALAQQLSVQVADATQQAVDATQQAAREQAIRDRVKLDARLEARLGAFLAGEISDKAAIIHFGAEAKDIESVIERELGEDLEIGPELIKQYVKGFMIRYDRGDIDVKGEAYRYRNAVTRWLYELSNSGNKITWIGGILNDVTINKLDAFKLPDGKTTKHPSIDNMGEIFLS